MGGCRKWSINVCIVLENITHNTKFPTHVFVCWLVCVWVCVYFFVFFLFFFVFQIVFSADTIPFSQKTNLSRPNHCRRHTCAFSMIVPMSTRAFVWLLYPLELSPLLSFARCDSSRFALFSVLLLQSSRPRGWRFRGNQNHAPAERVQQESPIWAGRQLHCWHRDPAWR